MKILTAQQQAILSYVERQEMPHTVREIAEAHGIPVSTVRAILATLERHGCIEKRGVSLGGGTTWARPADVHGEPR